MGYRFVGFFTRDEAPIEEATRRWPLCGVRRIDAPFVGWEFRCPDPEYDADSEEEHERLTELTYELEDTMPELGRIFPSSTIVFIRAVCFGGTCLYEGSVFHGERIDSAEGKRGEGALAQLVSHLGVALNEQEDFLPLAGPRHLRYRP